MSEDNNTTQDEFEDEILFAAARKNHLELFQEFYQERNSKNKFNANIVDHMGNTALHYSCTFGHYEITVKLLELGANPNIKNTTGETPLHKAVWKNYIKIVEALIENGADVTITDNSKKNALLLSKSQEMKTLLNQAMLSRNISNDDVADSDDDDEDEAAAKKPYKPTAHDHSDMVAADSDDE